MKNLRMSPNDEKAINPQKLCVLYSPKRLNTTPDYSSKDPFSDTAW